MPLLRLAACTPHASTSNLIFPRPRGEVIRTNSLATTVSAAFRSLQGYVKTK